MTLKDVSEAQKGFECKTIKIKDDSEPQKGFECKTIKIKEVSDLQEDFEPKIITILCNWCTYGAADLAGVSRFQYPPNIRVIRIPCSGRVSPKMILSALRNGADGVWISGCHPGDCHYLTGNFYARRKFILMKNFFEYQGVEQGRIHFSWISSAEGVKFAEVARDVVDSVAKLGPAKHFVRH
ncbi:MAG: hydrogenase iron-sulfur subunit [Desulfamplus sp.]|nr:hydrogenase iron-sulfur subunit [Desulfamplus sp.]